MPTPSTIPSYHSTVYTVHGSLCVFMTKRLWQRRLQNWVSPTLHRKTHILYGDNIQPTSLPARLQPHISQKRSGWGWKGELIRSFLPFNPCIILTIFTATFLLGLKTCSIRKPACILRHVMKNDGAILLGGVTQDGVAWLWVEARRGADDKSRSVCMMKTICLDYRPLHTSNYLASLSRAAISLGSLRLLTLQQVTGPPTPGLLQHLLWHCLWLADCRHWRQSRLLEEPLKWGNGG